MSTQKEIDREFVNWTKGVTGLVVTKVALCDHIITTWRHELKTWNTDEILHLPMFMKDIKSNKSKLLFYGKVQESEDKNSKWQIKCQCDLCQSIFNRLRELHKYESKKVVWNPAEEDPAEEEDKNEVNNKKDDDENLFKMVQQQPKKEYVEKFDEICNICKQKECPFERSRQGIPLFDQNKKEPTDGEKEKTIDEHFWQIANMYMFRGFDRNKVPNSGPEDTDVALVLKMMKNCKSFTIDDKKSDEVYDDLLEVRNFLMHTPDQRMPTKALDLCFKRMEKLLNMGKLKDDTYCQLAVIELSKLKELVIITSYFSGEEKDMIKQELIRTALYERQQSLVFDIKFKGNLKDEGQLRGLLKATIEKSKEYAEKEKSEQVSSEDKPKKDSSEDKPVQGSSWSEDKPKQGSSEVKSKQRSSKSSATTLGGAATGAAVGSIAGPPGAAIGAAVGWLFGKLAE